MPEAIIHPSVCGAVIRLPVSDKAFVTIGAQVCGIEGTDSVDIDALEAVLLNFPLTTKTKGCNDSVQMSLERLLAELVETRMEKRDVA